MNCPHCGSNQLNSEYKGAFSCGTLTDRNGWYHQTDFCKEFAEFRKPLDSKIQQLESERDALRARVKRLEEALEFGVGANRAKELMGDNHIGDTTELMKRTKEVPCPDCYGGHFRPCNICGDSGVALLRTEAKESKP